jgi:hemerythrin
MPILTWDDALYSVGHPTIDAQHKRLFDLVNEVHAAMLAGKGNEVIGKALSSLVTYVKVHFAAEERVMAACGYPALDQHKLTHEALTQKVMDFQARFAQGRTMMTIEVMNFLKSWLTDHIQATDRQYVKYLVTGGK